MFVIAGAGLAGAKAAQEPGERCGDVPVTPVTLITVIYTLTATTRYFCIAY